MNKLTNKIFWQAGYLAMIDNSKFLYSRRAFRDKQRQFYIQLSYLNKIVRRSIIFVIFYKITSALPKTDVFY